MFAVGILCMFLYAKAKIGIFVWMPIICLLFFRVFVMRISLWRIANPL